MIFNIFKTIISSKVYFLKMSLYFTSIGKVLVIIGAIIILIGIIVIYAHKIPYIGRLPGDIYIKRDNFVFYFPLTTCILISAVVYLILRIFKYKKM